MICRAPPPTASTSWPSMRRERATSPLIRSRSPPWLHPTLRLFPTRTPRPPPARRAPPTASSSSSSPAWAGPSCSVTWASSTATSAGEAQTPCPGPPSWRCTSPAPAATRTTRTTTRSLWAPSLRASWRGGRE